MEEERDQARLVHRVGPEHLTSMRTGEGLLLWDLTLVERQASAAVDRLDPELVLLLEGELFTNAPVVREHDQAPLGIAHWPIVVVIQIEPKVTVGQAIHKVDVVFIELNADVIGAEYGTWQRWFFSRTGHGRWHGLGHVACECLEAAVEFLRFGVIGWNGELGKAGWPLGAEVGKLRLFEVFVERAFVLTHPLGF